MWRWIKLLVATATGLGISFFVAHSSHRVVPPADVERLAIDVPPPGPMCSQRSGTNDPWRTGSALVFDEPRGRVYAADADRAVVRVFDGELQPEGEIAVGENPSQMVVDPDGTLFVAVRGGGDVLRVDARGRRRKVHLGGEPSGLASNGDGMLFVVRATADEVVALDSVTLSIRWRSAVGQAPRVVTALEDAVIVGHLKGSTLAVLNPSTGYAVAWPRLSDEALTATRALALTPIPGGVLAFHDIVDTGTGSGEAGGSGYAGVQPRPVVASMSLVGVTATPGVQTSPTFEAVDFDDCGPYPPVIISPLTVPGTASAVWLSGVGAFGIASEQADLVEFVLAPGPETKAESYPLSGGPRALAADASGSRLFVLTAFDREIHELSVAPAPHRPTNPNFTCDQLHSVAVSEVRTVALGPSGLPADVDAGRRLFRQIDPRISGKGLACATCHPEGGEDALTWSIEGATHATPSLAGRLEGTAPYNWEGSKPTLEASIALTIHRLGGKLPKRGTKCDAVIAPLAAYLRSLKPPDNPHRIVPPERGALVALGKELFESPSVGCNACHNADSAFTDGQNHDIGTTSPAELASIRNVRGRRKAAPEINTPSLRDLALTAPYLHDGSAPDLELLLVATRGHMGNTGELVLPERRALLAYLETL